MFDKYTEKARRVIFFARYEASQVGSPYIETQHLLLGLIEEDRALANHFLRSVANIESIRTQIEASTQSREKLSTSVDLPLSHESKRVLSYGAEESERLNHKHIGTEHILLGLLRVEKCFAADMLRERGLSLSTVREAIASSGSNKAESKRGTQVRVPGRDKGPQATPVKAKSNRGTQVQLLTEYGCDLTHSSIENTAPQVPAIEKDVDRVVEVLCRRASNNPVIMGDAKAVEAVLKSLARRIVDANVPADLHLDSVVAVDLLRLESAAMTVSEYRGLLNRLVSEVEDKEVLLVFNDVAALLSPTSDDGVLDVANVLYPAFMTKAMRFIVAGTGRRYKQLIYEHPFFSRLVCPIRVTTSISEGQCERIVFELKGRIETFHAVTFDDSAVRAAISLGCRDGSAGEDIVAAALDILDSAGAQARISRSQVPQEVREVQKRIEFAVNEMERAISDHQFEKARFYSDEERKELEELFVLRERLGLFKAPGIIALTSRDIEQSRDEGLL